MLRARPQRRRKVARLLQERLAHGRALFDELDRERVELREAARLLVEQAPSSAVCAALLVQVRDERLLGTRAVVVERLALRAFGEELDRREAPDTVLLAERAVVLRVCVDVDDEALQRVQLNMLGRSDGREETDVGLVREVLGDLLIDGLQTLAVAAPRCSERDDRVLVRVLPRKCAS